MKEEKKKSVSIAGRKLNLDISYVVGSGQTEV